MFIYLGVVSMRLISVYIYEGVVVFWHKAFACRNSSPFGQGKFHSCLALVLNVFHFDTKTTHTLYVSISNKSNNKQAHNTVYFCLLCIIGICLHARAFVSDWQESSSDRVLNQLRVVVVSHDGLEWLLVPLLLSRCKICNRSRWQHKFSFKSFGWDTYT